jgi:transcriptional regulator with XRE-family HTH domain
MTTSDMVRELCKKQNISLAEVARRIDQSPQNFNKKLKRDSLTYAELSAIADALGVNFELAFTMPSGEKITVDERSGQADDD